MIQNASSARAAPLGRTIALTAILLAATGCFRERPFPMRPGDFVLVSAGSATRPPTTREWLHKTHTQLRHMLPGRDARSLTTLEMVDREGQPIDVYAYFRRPPERLNSVWHNFYGLLHSAQATGTDASNGDPAPPWPGFEDVWIPINERLHLSARIGLAQSDGSPRYSDCIVLIPGLLGNNSLQRTREIARALRDSGLHVLALELRGFGQTEARQPDVFYTFGVLETGDLLAVAEWLQEKSYVRETGLIGFCWGANHALLAAWEDGRRPDDPIVAEHLRPYLRPRSIQPHYRAGIMAFSPVLRFAELVELLERPWPLLRDPALHVLQAGVRDRMIRKQHPEVSGNLRRLIELEFERSELNYPGAVDDGRQYLRFLPSHGMPAGDKLESARVPVLVIHAANDPLASAQAVAELFALTENPNVAGILLPGGGHVGFVAHARSYFYSLILNFFDPQHGPAASRSHPPPSVN